MAYSLHLFLSKLQNGGAFLTNLRDISILHMHASLSGTWLVVWKSWFSFCWIPKNSTATLLNPNQPLLLLLVWSTYNHVAKSKLGLIPKLPPCPYASVSPFISSLYHTGPYPLPYHGRFDFLPIGSLFVAWNSVKACDSFVNIKAVSCAFSLS